jgi:hypothetical protein
LEAGAKVAVAVDCPPCHAYVVAPEAVNDAVAPVQTVDAAGETMTVGCATTVIGVTFLSTQFGALDIGTKVVIKESLNVPVAVYVWFSFLFVKRPVPSLKFQI